MYKPKPKDVNKFSAYIDERIEKSNLSKEEKTKLRAKVLQDILKVI